MAFATLSEMTFLREIISMHFLFEEESQSFPQKNYSIPQKIFSIVLKGKFKKFKKIATE